MNYNEVLWKLLGNMFAGKQNLRRDIFSNFSNRYVKFLAETNWARYECKELLNITDSKSNYNYNNVSDLLEKTAVY